MASVRKLYDWDYETVDWINKNARYVNSSAIDIDREATINATLMKDSNNKPIVERKNFRAESTQRGSIAKTDISKDVVNRRAGNKSMQIKGN